METCTTCSAKAHARAEGRTPGGEPALRITYECGAVREWRKPGAEWQFYERLQPCGRLTVQSGPTTKVRFGMGIPSISGS